ncbi:MAG: hypothetical protein Q9190_007726 [Brigantiaea leucoxantha]
MPKDLRSQPTQPSQRPGPYSRPPNMTPPVSSRNSRDKNPNPGDRHSSTPWTPEDDRQLIDARQQLLNWAPIAHKYFPTKTPNACRKRHERLMEKRNNNGSWDAAKIEALATTYSEVREQMWKILADRLQENWKTVERKCFESGWKTLTKTSRSAAQNSQLCHPNSAPDNFNDSGFMEEPDAGVDNLADDEPPFSAVSRTPSSRKTTLSNASSDGYPHSIAITTQQPPLRTHFSESYPLPPIKTLLEPPGFPVTTC